MIRRPATGPYMAETRTLVSLVAPPTIPTAQRWALGEVERLYRQPLLPLLEQAHDVHRRAHPEPEVQLCQLLSIKTGGCPEDCGYCPQSAHYDTGLAAEKLLDTGHVLEVARQAKDEGATRFCMGAAWRSAPAADKKEFEQVLEMVRGVSSLGLEVCCTLGMLNATQAAALAAAGLTAYNHNLDTSPEFYGKVISTRTYQDRLDTLAHVRQAGISVCCGGILGMGEQEEDRIRLLHVLANLPTPPESVPINALVAVAGTPLAEQPPVDAFDFVRAIATARILMPQSKVRLSAGRLALSKEAQALCFYAGANSIFLGEKLLTTPNPETAADHALLRTLGLLPEPPAAKPAAAPPALEAALAAELAGLEAQSRRRHLHPPAGEDFCSNDYLGLSRHPAIRAAVARAALSDLPLGSTGSRLVRGDQPQWGALEARFARFRGTPAALFFSSGYAANLGVLSTLLRREDLVFSDALNHASLIDGIRLSGAERVILPHLDLAAWEPLLRRRRAPGRRAFLVVESIYSMAGDRAPLRAIAALCRELGVELIVDEAHATGLCGPGGEGALVEAGLADAALVSLHPCGKALGAAGGFVACSQVVRDYLVNRARPFIFSTAPPPLLAVQLDAALDVLATEPWRRERVWVNARALTAQLAAAGLLPAAPHSGLSPILAVRLGADAHAMAVAARLAAQGFDVRAIRPPSVPEGQSQLRITVNAEQDPATVERFGRAVIEAVKV